MGACWIAKDVMFLHDADKEDSDIMKTSLNKYTDNFTTKKMKIFR